MTMPIHSILVGVADLENDPVLAPAAELAQRVGAELYVVHAFEIPDSVLRADAAQGTPETEIRRTYEEKLGERLRAQVQRLSSEVKVHARALAAPAGDALVSVAADANASLIVVAAFRQGPSMRQILGSTADRVIRMSTVPVLVLRPPYTTRFTHLLFTTDLSPLSARALERGAGVASQLVAPEVPEVRCVEVSWTSEWARTPAAPEQLEREGCEALGRFLEPLDLPFEDVQLRVRIGDPAKEIVAEAAEWNAELIVIGTRGRVGVSRYLLGSVAGSVLRSAMCDVLVVPTETGEADTASEAAPGAA